VDDGAHVFAFQGIEDMFRMMQGVDDLKLLQALCALEQGKNRPLDD
jgi:hypothetical protein